jgi:hypothetical protein
MSKFKKLTSILIIQAMVLVNFTWAGEFDSERLTPRLMLLDAQIKAGFGSLAITQLGKMDNSLVSSYQSPIKREDILSLNGRIIYDKDGRKYEIRVDIPSEKRLSSITIEAVETGLGYYQMGKHPWIEIDIAFDEEFKTNIIFGRYISTEFAGRAKKGIAKELYALIGEIAPRGSIWASTPPKEAKPKIKHMLEVAGFDKLLSGDHPIAEKIRYPLMLKKTKQIQASKTGDTQESNKSSTASRIESRIQRYRPESENWELIRKDIMRVGKDYFGRGKPAGHFWPEIEKSFQSPTSISLIATAKVRGKDRIVGYLTGMPQSEDRIYVVGAAVEVKYRENKIANKLFKEFVEVSRQYGFKKLKAHTDEVQVIKAIKSAGCSLFRKLRDDSGSCLFFNIPAEDEIIAPLKTIAGDVGIIIEQAI